MLFGSTSWMALAKETRDEEGKYADEEERLETFLEGAVMDADSAFAEGRTGAEDAGERDLPTTEFEAAEFWQLADWTKSEELG